MKRVILILVFLLLGATALITYRVSVPKGSIVISKSYMDSLMNIQPDTITRYDTIPSPPDTVRLVKEVPVPVYLEDSTLIAYHDSLVNDKVSIHILDTITNRGIIKNREWRVRYFIPQYIINENTIIKPVPTPYPYCEKKKVRVYTSLGLGLSEFSVVGGVVFRDRFTFGVQAGNLGTGKGRFIFN
jgi:hypothetical protein